jgi:dephospho-CoA kinase
MKVYGLTGGIASGKSSVARMLRELGAEVVDADELARVVVRPGTPGLQKIVETFSPDVVLPDGTLDRKKLGERIFADPSARAQLNAITHPLIAAETAQRMRELEARGVPFAFYEAALLVDNGAHRALDGLVVVETSPAVQRARLVERDGLTPAEADRRLAAQLPNAARREAADVVLPNDGAEQELAQRVQLLYARLRDGDPLRPREGGAGPPSTGA